MAIVTLGIRVLTLCGMTASWAEGTREYASLTYLHEEFVSLRQDWEMHVCLRFVRRSRGA